MIDYDAYEEYEDTVRPARHKPKATPHTERDDLAESGETITMSYKPARFEAGWLVSSIEAFYHLNHITDVQASVKGGKEASVYRCAAHPSTGQTLLAAKVYRPRKFRNLRNDALYREGRAILTETGTAAKKTDHRLMRAIGKKTDFGVQAQHTSWLMYEFTTLDQLYRAGAAVPQPVAASENAILMGYQGDENKAAPTLIEVALEEKEAQPLFEEVIRNIALMLENGLVHGDLSAYNILYWQGRVTLIDFPQITHCAGNSQARFILQRDLTRVCDYFSRQGAVCDPDALLEELWERYGPKTFVGET